MPSAWEFQLKRDTGNALKYREERQREIIAKRRNAAITTVDPAVTASTNHQASESSYQRRSEPTITNVEPTLTVSSVVGWFYDRIPESFWGFTQQMTPRQPDPPALISRNMPAAEMIKILTIGSGIEDLTTRIDLKHCSLNPVATGGFGDIYHGNLLGMTRLRPSEKIAIKSIRQYPDDSPETKRMLKAAARELHTWSRLKHENVQTLLGLASFRDRIAMISPWISGGNLLDYIRGNPNADRCKLAYQSANAVAYIHELKPKIAHGDIKSGNFLVTDTGTVKLNDFGTTLVADATQRFTAEGTKSALAMSTRWTSPELLNEDSDTYSHEADVYALGMTILEIFTGKIPFPDKQRDGPIIKFVTEGGRPTRPIEIPHCQDGDLLWDLLSSCWSSNPKSRPNANHVKEETGRLSQEGLALPSSVELE